MLILVLAGLSLFFPGDAWAATHHPIHQIVIENMQFNPKTITVQAGDTIIWKNEDLVPHTVTASNRSIDSKSIDPGKSFRFKPHREGSFPYSCRFHPTMTGTLIVK